MHQRGYSPDLAAMPTRSTARVESGRERDAAALAAMLPPNPTPEERRAVGLQARVDQQVRATPLQRWDESLAAAGYVRHPATSRGRSRTVPVSTQELERALDDAVRSD